MHNKSFKAVAEMSELLVRDRGLVCSDIDELKRCLSRVNYYRFSGYAREFQRDPKRGNNDFIILTPRRFLSPLGIDPSCRLP